jgi:hypothetical protein
MSSIFDGTSGFTSVSLHGQIQSGQNANLDIVRDVVRYQLLYSNMLNRMRQYLNLYTSGSYNELKQVFTKTALNQMLTTNNDSFYYNTNVDELIDFTYDPNTFLNYKKSLFSMLTGFSLSVKQNDDLVAMTRDCNEKTALLMSKEKLIEYIRREFTDKISMDAFYISQEFNTNIELKPWYSLYLQMYGPPYDGLFDAEKMANVVEILVNQNVITIDTFMGDYL